MLLFSFSSLNDGAIAQGQFLGPFGTEPHTLEDRCRLAMGENWEATQLVATADVNGGVSGTTTLTLRIAGAPVASVDIAAGDNSGRAAVGPITLNQDDLATVELTLAPDAGGSAYSLSVYGRSV